MLTVDGARDDDDSQQDMEAVLHAGEHHAEHIEAEDSRANESKRP